MLRQYGICKIVALALKLYTQNGRTRAVSRNNFKRSIESLVLLYMDIIFALFLALIIVLSSVNIKVINLHQNIMQGNRLAVIKGIAKNELMFLIATTKYGQLFLVYLNYTQTVKINKKLFYMNKKVLVSKM